MYKEFVLPYEKRLIRGLQNLGAKVRLHICGNTKRILDGMGQVGADIVDLDFPSPLADARAAMGPDQVLLGNIDPVRVLLNGTPEAVRERDRRMPPRRRESATSWAPAARFRAAPRTRT